MNERWVYEEAERRLGRALSESERRIDIVEYTRDLERGKSKLHAAIEEEKMRVVASRIKGRRGKLKVTPAMIEALAFLHRRGLAHAHAELRAAGVEPSRALANREEMSALRELLTLLRSMLGRVTRRVDLELDLRKKKRIDIGISGAARAALVKAMGKAVPGSLAISADLVSTAMAGGLAEGFEQDADLFATWEYSAVMDGATCPKCRALDGTVYPSWAAIMVVLPDGGPNPLCRGNGRCRCRPVPGRVKVP